MTVRRPDLVEALVAHGIPPALAEGSTRKQMEEGDLPRLKGRRAHSRLSYGPREGAIALLGLAGAGPADAHTAYATFVPLQAKQTSGGIARDPIGALLPDLMVPSSEDDGDEPIGAVPLLAALLTNISRLSKEDTRRLQHSPEAQSAQLELGTDPAFLLFRWVSEGTERFALCEGPPSLRVILHEGPPAFERVTKLRFPLLLAVGRLFAGVTAQNETTASSSGTGNPAGLSEDLSAPENEKASDPGRSEASTRFQSCNSASKRSHTTGAPTTSENSVVERGRQALKRGGWGATPQPKAFPHAEPPQRAHSAHAHPE